MHRLLAAAALGVATLSAHAIDPATARGTLQLGGERIALTHVVAVRRDNAEGLLDRPNELRVAITDREVRPEALWGVAFLPVTTMAARGEVRGVLLRWDPARRDGYVLTVLRTPEPGMSLANTTITDSAGALPGVKIGDRRVVGKAGSPADTTLPERWQAEFSAPLFEEPGVTADLRGAAAKSSPQVKTLRAIQQGLAKGDWNVQRGLATEASNRQLDLMLEQGGPAIAKQMAGFARQAAEALRKDIAAVDRVVVRDKRALVMMGKGSWRPMALDGDTWKVDE